VPIGNSQEHIMLFKALGAAAVAASSLLLPTTRSAPAPSITATGIDSARRVLGGIFGGRAPVTTGTSTRSSSSSRVPPGQRPPAGMCRVWIDGVPPGHQPAVTDCATAQVQAAQTANARVIYGDQESFPGRGRGSVKRSDDNDDDRGVREQDNDSDDEAGNGGVLGNIGARTSTSARAQVGGRPSWAGGKSRGHGRGHGGD
jgi:hypothetical protein